MNRQRRKEIRAAALRTACLVIEQHLVSMGEPQYDDEAETELWEQEMRALATRLDREADRAER